MKKPDSGPLKTEKKNQIKTFKTIAQLVKNFSLKTFFHTLEDIQRMKGIHLITYLTNIPVTEIKLYTLADNITTKLN